MGTLPKGSFLDINKKFEKNGLPFQELPPKPIVFSSNRKYTWDLTPKI